jgi:hypothetical protein
MNMSNTHLGQPPANHVLLESIGVASTGDPATDLDFFRTLPDGSTTPSGPAGFRVPARQVLIITDVDWQYAGSPGTSQTFRIFIKSLKDSNSPGRRVFESTIELDGEGNGGISEAMTAGFVVSSEVRLAVDTSPGGGKIQHVLLRGYLVPAG